MPAAVKNNDLRKNKEINDNMQMHIDRNAHIHKIIKFLFNTQQSFLHVIGPYRVGKTTIVHIAVHLAMQRDRSNIYKDGVKLIDCERAGSITEVEVRLRKTFKFDAYSNQNMDEIADELADRHICVIFDNCDKLIECEKETKLFEKMQSFHQKVKTIFISRKG